MISTPDDSIFEMLYTFLPRRMNLRQLAPYMVTFILAFGISLAFWRVTVFRQRDWRLNYPGRKGNTLVKVADISKDLKSQLEYVHDQNSKIHRARNLAIDKMIEIQEQKDEIAKVAREHAKRADQKDVELQQHRQKFSQLSQRVDNLKTEILRMRELQRLMDEERAANELVKKKLREENETLKKQLESMMVALGGNAVTSITP